LTGRKWEGILQQPWSLFILANAGEAWSKNGGNADAAITKNKKRRLNPIYKAIITPTVIQIKWYSRPGTTSAEDLTKKRAARLVSL
jgi:hypothetical protein